MTTDGWRKGQVADYRSGTDAVLQASQRELETYTVHICGEPIIVHLGVHSPKYFDDTLFYAESLPRFDGQTVLEIGSGTGALSVRMARLGASHVLAVDISEAAVGNTRANVAVLGLSEIIETRRSDVYDSVHENERFDTIVWNIPWGYVEEEVSLLERTVHDPFYASVGRCLSHAHQFLAPGGKLLIGISISLGRMDKIAMLATNARLSHSVFAQRPATQKNPVSVEWIEMRTS